MGKYYKIVCVGAGIWFRKVGEPIPFEGNRYKSKEAARKDLKAHGWEYSKWDHEWYLPGHRDWELSAYIKSGIEGE